MYKLISAAALLAASGSVLAAPSYDFVQVSYVQTEFEDLKPFKLKGFEIKGSMELGRNFFVQANYFDTEDNISEFALDIERCEINFGYIQRISDVTSIDYQIGYGEIDILFDDSEQEFKDGTNYYTPQVNLRHHYSANIEVYAGLEWQLWDEGSDQKAYKLGGQYNWDNLAVGSQYTKFSDSEVFAVFVKYQF
ncbi:hypothetical protein [Glaciecola sp. 1036]|uniref:hypothetical protein n=1 Tax=Alteromonadaceae TaxID=72275 RepID=UPI003D02825C